MEIRVFELSGPDITFGIPGAETWPVAEIVEYLNKWCREYEFYLNNGEIWYRPYGRQVRIKS